MGLRFDDLVVRHLERFKRELHKLWLPMFDLQGP